MMERLWINKKLKKELKGIAIEIGKPITKLKLEDIINGKQKKSYKEFRF